jgi:sugar phosphate isomerase/epimerase
LTALELTVCASIPAISEDFDLCTSYLETSADLGIRGIEVKLGQDDLITSRMRSWLELTLPSYDFKVYTHLPYLHGEDNVASPDPKRAGRAGRIMIESIGFSSGLGCNLVNTHMGVDLGKGPHIARAASRMIQIAEEARNYGVEISVENQENRCHGILNTPGDIGVLIESYPEVRLTYDAGHGNTHGFGVAEFLPVMIEKLRYLHLHDNNGGWDEHLALGRGNLDIPLLLEELGKVPSDQPVPLVLELSLQDLGSSLEYLKSIRGKGVIIL